MWRVSDRVIGRLKNARLKNGRLKTVALESLAKQAFDSPNRAIAK
jgi:hypothetical protein